MNCPNCNQPLPQESSAFCPNCGAQVGVRAAEPVRPQVQTAAPVQTVPSHLALGIFSTLCCCLPLGIVSIVYAAQVSSQAAAGNIAGAMESSRKAKFWGVLSIVLGGIGTLIIGGLQVVAAFAANAAN